MSQPGLHEVLDAMAAKFPFAEERMKIQARGLVEAYLRLHVPGIDDESVAAWARAIAEHSIAVEKMVDLLHDLQDRERAGMLVAPLSFLFCVASRLLFQEHGLYCFPKPNPRRFGP